MVDSPTCIVLLGSNRNRVGKMTLLATGIALLFRLHWVLSSMSPLNILIHSSRSLEIVGVLNDLTP
jgi:hypothetical protein